MRGFIIIGVLVVALAVVGYLNMDSWIAIACLLGVIWLVGLALSRIGDNLGHKDLSIDSRKFPLDKNPG